MLAGWLTPPEFLANLPASLGPGATATAALSPLREEILMIWGSSSRAPLEPGGCRHVGQAYFWI